ncbi:MAG: sulfate/molybdate ABC transporter ATP-binding protein [Bacteroidota bacterium]
MIEVEDLTKRFGAFTALNRVSLTVPKGKLVALLGPSGSGKTTLLRILAGLDFPDSGAVRLDGVDATTLATRDRGVGFVFQHYALFRHMTVADNIAFGLRVRKGAARPSKAVIAAKVDELLGLVQLDGLGRRYPAQLSGGQRQRVALARALAIEPRLLLLDEPFGALDAQVRKDLRRWLRSLHEGMGLTGVFVTHDQEEALEVADEVVVMSNGRIEQVGTPREIYDHPATPFVYRFLGNVNALPVEVRHGRAALEGLELVCASGGDESGAGTAFIRPHDIEVRAAEAEGLAAQVRHLSVLGPLVRAELAVGAATTLEAELTRDEHDRLNLSPGSAVRLGIRSARLFVE